MPVKKGWVSQSEAGRLEGVSQQWIAQLIKQKRLGKNRKKQVFMPQVRAVRAMELDPSRGKHKPKAPPTARAQKGRPAKRDSKSVPTPAVVAPARAPAELLESSIYNAARGRREEQQALLAEFDVRKRIGELVEWPKIEALNASTAVMIRESMLAIPDRLAAVLAAEIDEKRVRQLMDGEIRGALAALTSALKRPTRES